MTETYKERQVRALFDPQTVNDKEAVVLLGSLGRLSDEHKGDVAYINTLATLGAVIISLAREGELDEALIQQEIRKAYEAFMPPDAPS